jgi:hypothetical protein
MGLCDDSFFRNPYLLNILDYLHVPFDSVMWAFFFKWSHSKLEVHPQISHAIGYSWNLIQLRHICRSLPGTWRLKAQCVVSALCLPEPLQCFLQNIKYKLLRLISVSNLIEVNWDHKNIFSKPEKKYTHLIFITLQKLQRGVHNLWDLLWYGRKLTLGLMATVTST